MDEKFDDLFDDFFKKRKEDKPSLNDELKKIIETIMKFKKMAKEEDLEDAIDSELGEPTEVEEFIQDGFKIKRMTWKTPHGSFVKLVLSEIGSEDVETETNNSTKRKSLQEQLDEAVAAEDYALAIKLRDKINAGGR